MNIIKRPLGLYKANCYVLIKDGKSIVLQRMPPLPSLLGMFKHS